MKNKTVITILIAATIYFSCKSKLKPTQYMKWVNNKENGLIVEKQIGAFIYYLQYKPIEYQALIELGSTTNNESVFRKKTEEYKGLEYYTLRIGSADKATDFLKKGIQNENEYYARIEYFSSFVQKDIRIAYGKDTFPCVMEHLERTYKMSSFNNLILAFNPTGLANNMCDRTLIFNDRTLGTGLVKITIKGETIKKIPTVSI